MAKLLVEVRHGLGISLTATRMSGSGRPDLSIEGFAGKASHRALSASQVTDSATEKDAIIVPAKPTTSITIGVFLHPL